MQSPDNCLNCEAKLHGEYCSKCGQDNINPRLTFRSIAADAWEHLVELDTPILRSVWNLTWRPGWVAAEFVRGRRKAFANPLKYCLIAGALFTLYLNIVGTGDVGDVLTLHTEDEAAKEEVLASFQIAMDWTMDYIGILIIAILPALAVAMRLLFWKRGYNTMEYYVLSLFAYGHALLLQLLLVLTGTTDWLPVGLFYNLLPIILFAVASVQFINRGIWLTVLLSTIAHVTFYVILSVIAGAASVIYFLINHSELIESPPA